MVRGGDGAWWRWFVVVVTMALCGAWFCRVLVVRGSPALFTRLLGNNRVVGVLFMQKECGKRIGIRSSNLPEDARSALLFS